MIVQTLAVLAVASFARAEQSAWAQCLFITHVWPVLERILTIDRWRQRMGWSNGVPVGLRLRRPERVLLAVHTVVARHDVLCSGGRNRD
jgi:hypothetical protein